MTYGTATYGGTALGSEAIIDNDITSRVPERELVRTIRVERRELML